MNSYKVTVLDFVDQGLCDDYSTDSGCGKEAVVNR